MKNTKIPHVHADVIKAWADGHEIEYYSQELDCWRDVGCNCPSWYNYRQYRVKRQPVIEKVWVYAEHFEQKSERLGAKIWNETEKDNLGMSTIQVTLTDGKVTAVELLKK